MTAVELRIGNYLSPIGIGISIVTFIDSEQDLIGTNNFADRGIDDFNPIPLTEEWLLKFGFITTQWDNFDSYRLEIGNNDYAIVIYSDGKCEVGDVIITKINYVHQLQNLYFALLGEELTFKSE